MNPQLLIIVLIIGMITLFIWDKIRHDAVALIGLLTAVILGLVKPAEAFSGFGHPAVITVGFVLILSYAISRSGALDYVEKTITRGSKSTTMHILFILLLAGALSMFMNNVAALALIMPLAISSAKKLDRSPSLILMPLSFGSILGGLVTLIGTPPNIIVATYREQALGKAFKMFDFAPVGGIVALVGILFISIVGWRLVKNRIPSSKNKSSLFEITSYVSEIKVSEDSNIVGDTIEKVLEKAQDLDLVICSLVHKGEHTSRLMKNDIVKDGDIFLVEGGPDAIDKFVSKFSLTIIGPDKVDKELLTSIESNSYEVVVPPRSRIQGRFIKNINFRRRFEVNLLGVYREGTPYRGRLSSFKLAAGDVILLHGEPDNVSELIQTLGLLPLAERPIEVGRRKHDAPLAIAFYGAAIALASFEIIPIPIALALATILMILTKVLPLREVYNKIDWSVIVLLAAMIPIGQAFESSGATKTIAETVIQFSHSINPLFVITLLLAITMITTDVLNNAATAILMAPIAKVIADGLSLNADPFLMAVAVGASCAFLTPIGHQNNILVMGAGGYRFGDYWRLGLPLDIIIILIAPTAILYFWPL